MKDATKAQRRHQAQRVKRNQSEDLRDRPHLTPSAVGKHASTAAPCSCALCGNPRKYRGELTVQERKFLDVSRSYLMGETG